MKGRKAFGWWVFCSQCEKRLLSTNSPAHDMVYPVFVGIRLAPDRFSIERSRMVRHD